jgi:hypothetical protein
VWAVGEGTSGVRVGDEVVIGGVQWDEKAPDVRLGADPVASQSQLAWGYEGELRILRAVRPRARLPVPSQARQRELGAGGGLHADRGDRLPPTVRMASEHSESW